MDPATLTAYANLVLDSCIRLVEGDRLRINAEIAHRGLVHALAGGAWERGARAVRVEWTDSRLSRLMFDRARDAWFDEAPSHLARDARAYVDEGWSLVSLIGDEDPAALDGADPGRMQRAQRARSAAVQPFREAVRSNRIAWTVVPAPTAAWGRAVLTAAGRETGADPADTLWEALVPILRLDAPDPAAAIRANAEALAARAAALDAARLVELRLRGPGTDLRVGLSPRSRWVGGSSRTPGGRVFLPNHPTEEVFTSPDRHLAEGRASTTRPVKVMGETVEGAWFEFAKGAVVASGARKGAELLARYLELDPGARHLGELALVDATGPIWRSGLVFDNGLIDENAACHIALGSAYFDAFEGSEGMDAAAKEAAGFNDSLVHTDFMIGSDEVEVTGSRANGTTMDIIRGGKFLL